MEQLVGLLGILGGAAFGGIGAWLGHKKAAKNRAIDERFQAISVKSQSASWKMTLGALYAIFILYVVGVPFSVPAALGILLFVHMAGWAFSLFFYNQKY